MVPLLQPQSVNPLWRKNSTTTRKAHNENFEEEIRQRCINLAGASIENCRTNVSFKPKLFSYETRKNHDKLSKIIDGQLLVKSFLDKRGVQRSSESFAQTIMMEPIVVLLYICCCFAACWFVCLFTDAEEMVGTFCVVLWFCGVQCDSHLEPWSLPALAKQSRSCRNLKKRIWWEGWKRLRRMFFTVSYK